MEEVGSDWGTQAVGSDWETQEVGAVGMEKNGGGVNDLHRGLPATSLVTKAVVCGAEEVPTKQFDAGAEDIRGHSQAPDLEDDVLEDILNTLVPTHTLCSKRKRNYR